VAESPMVSTRLLSKNELQSIWPVSEMTIWRHERAGTMPRPIRVGRRRYWRADEIETWLQALTAQR